MIISFVVILGVVGLLGCGEVKDAGKTEFKKAAEGEADRVKAAVEDRTAKPKEEGENVRADPEGRREDRREGR